jgi:hypothetical protein
MVLPVMKPAKKPETAICGNLPAPRKMKGWRRGYNGRSGEA